MANKENIMHLIGNYLVETVSGDVIGLILLLFFIILVWREKKGKSSVDNGSDIGRLETKFDGLEARFGKLETRFDSLETRFNDFLDKLIGIIGPQLFKSSSPLTLTDLGKSISEKIGATELANDYAKKLHDEVKDLNAYEIQEYCFEFCEEKLPAKLKEEKVKQLERMQTVAFEEGIEVEKIMRIVAIELRDKLLSIQGTSHSEIDEHSPDQTDS